MSRIWPGDVQKAVNAMRSQMQQAAPQEPSFSTMSLQDVLAASLPSLRSPIPKFLHEGLWVFGGRSKRGKSWLMLDMATGVSAGQLVFGALPTQQTRVLYICLEDGIRRVQSRLRQLDLSSSTPHQLEIAFQFPKLDAGGQQALINAMAQYGLIIVDVATKILPRSQGKSDPYEEHYDMLTPLHDAANAAHCTFILIDHLRKSSAEDPFDEIHGTVAKQGVADALMILQRAPRDNELLLHMRGKEFAETTHALYFNGRNFQYRGEGESFALKAEQQKIIDILLEESPTFLSIQDVMQALGLTGPQHYQRLRRSILQLQRDGFVGVIYRKGRRLYSAMVKAKYERLAGEHHADKFDDEVPF